jgi:phosphatidylserine synthase
MNGVCGSFSIFSSAQYLLTNNDDYLWWALALPLAGLMFDFMDGKVARWRKSSSMLGQELDSLADLVCHFSVIAVHSPNLMFSEGIIWCRTSRACLCCGSSDIP